MAQWDQVTTGLGCGGYVAWEAVVATATANTTQTHVPVFVRLMPATVAGMTLIEAIERTLALPGIVLTRQERAQLAQERTRTHVLDVRFVAFCPRAMLDQLPAFWKVLRPPTWVCVTSSFAVVV